MLIGKIPEIDARALVGKRNMHPGIRKRRSAHTFDDLKRKIIAKATKKIGKTINTGKRVEVKSDDK